VPRIGLGLHPRDGPQDRGSEHLNRARLRTAEPPALPRSSRTGEAHRRGAGHLIGRVRKDTPSVAFDPSASALSTKDPLVVVIRRPSRLSGQKSCPCCHWSNSNVPIALATGGP
jgi:hypothetical protein